MFLTQIEEPAMSMSTQLYDPIGNPGAESPGSTTPGDSSTPGALEHSPCECSRAEKWARDRVRKMA